MCAYVYAVGFVKKGFVMVYNVERSGWEFPGGSIEAGETAEAAAVREFREETGRCLEPRGSVRYPDGGQVFVGYAGEEKGPIVDADISKQEVFSELPSRIAFPRREYLEILARARRVIPRRTRTQL